MKLHPTPVVMLSAHTREGAKETFEALAAGAVDFLAKPSGEVSAELAKIGVALRDKVAAAAGSRPMPIGARAPPRPTAAHTASRAVGVVGPKVAIVGVSTGGPAGARRFLPRFPADTSLAILVVQPPAGRLHRRARGAPRLACAPSRARSRRRRSSPEAAWR